MGRPSASVTLAEPQGEHFVTGGASSGEKESSAVVESACANPGAQAHTTSSAWSSSSPARPRSTAAFGSAHTPHVAAPAVSDVKPAGQGSHHASSGDVAPTGPNWPAGHRPRSLPHARAAVAWPAIWPKVPEGHGVQLAAPAAAKEPAAHSAGAASPPAHALPAGMHAAHEDVAALQKKPGAHAQVAAAASRVAP